MSKRVANPEKLEELDSKIGTVPSGQTVEGQISSLNSKITNVITQDIKTDALNVTGLSVFYANGTYTGDIPDDTFKYATFIVQRTSASSISILATSTNSGKSATIVFSNNSWGSWHVIAWA